jgi:hypothetical protein
MKNLIALVLGAGAGVALICAFCWHLSTVMPTSATLGG